MVVVGRVVAVREAEVMEPQRTRVVEACVPGPAERPQRQRMQRFQNNGASTTAANRNRPTSAQFVQAALRFDADSDGELNSTELTDVATAVINELRIHPAVVLMTADSPASVRAALDRRRCRFELPPTAFHRSRLPVGNRILKSLSKIIRRLLRYTD